MSFKNPPHINYYYNHYVRSKVLLDIMVHLTKVTGKLTTSLAHKEGGRKKLKVGIE